jgi:CRP-like cAMP-binding protein
MKTLSCNLTDCFLCRHCMPEWKELTAQKKQTIRFARGQNIFTEGERVNGIYFMYEGAVKVEKKWNREKELILSFARSGDILGHRGIGFEDSYPVTATALIDSTVCFISIDFLKSSLRANPNFTYSLMQFYAAELQKAENRLKNLAHMDVRGRIADTLLEMLEVFGESKDKFIRLAITRQDISSYAGTTYETVFKFFTELEKKKIILTRKKRIRILQKDQLNKFIR